MSISSATMEKLVLLLTVTLAAGYYTDDGEYIDRHIILRNSDKCMMAQNVRELLDRHHNYLRQKVAFGEEYLGKNFTRQKMTGLMYDCEFEVKARNELEHPGSLTASNLGVVRFRREYKKSRLDVVQAAMEALLNEEDKLRQMTNPRATKFGCYIRLGRFPPNNVPEIDGLCVYDKKTRKRNPQKPKGEPCLEDWEEGDDESRKCFIPNSKCLWGLCYVLPEGEDLSILQ